MSTDEKAAIDSVAAQLLATFSKEREGGKRRLESVSAEERSFWRLMARTAIRSVQETNSIK